MTAADCVIVVKRDDGIWDASCWDERCGHFIHSLQNDAGEWAHDGFPSEAAARRAATRHRAELKRIADAEKRCPHCDQRIPQEART